MKDTIKDFIYDNTRTHLRLTVDGNDISYIKNAMPDGETDCVLIMKETKFDWRGWNEKENTQLAALYGHVTGRLFIINPNLNAMLEAGEECSLKGIETEIQRGIKNLIREKFDDRTDLPAINPQKNFCKAEAKQHFLEDRRPENLDMQMDDAAIQLSDIGRYINHPSEYLEEQATAYIKNQPDHCLEKYQYHVALRSELQRLLNNVHGNHYRHRAILGILKAKGYDYRSYVKTHIVKGGKSCMVKCSASSIKSAVQHGQGMLWISSIHGRDQGQYMEAFGNAGFHIDDVRAILDGEEIIYHVKESVSMAG